MEFSVCSSKWMRMFSRLKVNVLSVCNILRVFIFLSKISIMYQRLRAVF